MGWSENKHPLSVVIVSVEENAETQQVRRILHSGSIDTLIGPSSGWPRIRISCVAGSMFSDRFLDRSNGGLRSDNRLTSCNRRRVALLRLWVYGRQPAI